VPAYFRALAKEWLNILFGETLVGIGFLIWWALGAPTNHALVVVFVVAMLVAGYYAWRSEYLRLQPAFAIGKLVPQSWADAETAKHGLAYYFEVISKSETASIRDVQVQVAEIDPYIENLEWSPIHLRLRSDSNPFTAAKAFTINPGQTKQISFVFALEGNDYFTIPHSTVGFPERINSKVRRRLKVVISGTDIPALITWFEVYFDSEGVFVCEIEPKTHLPPSIRPSAASVGCVPTPCLGPWHVSPNAPGATCPKCGLAFPRERVTLDYRGTAS
jgi:hypothetical protein